MVFSSTQWKAVFYLTLFFILALPVRAQFSLLKDIDPTQDDAINSSISQQVELNGVSYFVSGDGITNRELWRSDGTAAGTYLVKDFNTLEVPIVSESSISYLTKMGDAIYFSADDGTGSELWKTDGTFEGTVIVKQINTNVYGFSNPRFLTNINGTLFFSADDYNGVYGSNQELWKSDGTASGTVKVKEIRAGDNSSDPANLVNVNGTLFFVANDGNANSYGNQTVRMPVL